MFIDQWQSTPPLPLSKLVSSASSPSFIRTICLMSLYLPEFVVQYDPEVIPAFFNIVIVEL